MKHLLSLVVILMIAVPVLSAEKSAKEYLADLDSNKDEKTVVEAVKWAGEKKSKNAVPALINLLNDRREDVRMRSAVSLGLIGDKSAVEPLNKTLLSDGSPEVRYAAILATFQLGSSKSISAWKEAREKETDPYIRDILTRLEEKAKSK
jgi:HEAT repeat protein